MTPTLTLTSTPTSTPTNTPTLTMTPTQARYQFATYVGPTPNQACELFSALTIYGDYELFDNNTQFYDSDYGPVTTDMSGYYSFNNQVTEIGSDGSQIGSFSSCGVLPTLTPTPTLTSTPTPTLTSTPTPTPTTTSTPTPTLTSTMSFYEYSLGYDASATAVACSNYTSSPSTVYAPLAGGPGPNIGEYLYSDSGVSTPVSDGYYSNGAAWYRVTGGSGLITSSDPNGCFVTPTPTITETVTNTPTLTQTPTITPSSTSAPYRNFTIQNYYSGGLVITEAPTTSFDAEFQNVFPLAAGLTDAWHGTIVSGDTCSISITGITSYQWYILKNGVVLDNIGGSTPANPTYTFLTDFTEDDTLRFEII